MSARPPGRLTERVSASRPSSATDSHTSPTGFSSVPPSGPATPVVVSGLEEVATAGDIFQVVNSEKSARGMALAKLQEKRTNEAAATATPRITLEELARRAVEGEVKELNLVIKADAQGSLEALRGAREVRAAQVAGAGCRAVRRVRHSDALLEKLELLARLVEAGRELRRVQEPPEVVARVRKMSAGRRRHAAGVDATEENAEPWTEDVRETATRLPVR